MNELVPTCPVCACGDLNVHAVLEAPTDSGARTECPVCGWTGKLSETVAMSRKDRHQWSAEAAAERLARVFQLRGVSAALVRVLQASSVLPELIGIDGLRPEQHAVIAACNESAAESINNVMRAGLEGFIKEAFTVAVREAVRHQQVLEVLRKNTSKDTLSNDRVFGGGS